MDNTFAHYSVLLAESIEALAINPDGIYLDGTFGRGGHSQHILNVLSAKGRLIALERAPQAIAAAQRFADDPRFSIHHVTFSQMADVAEQLQLAGKIDGILLDLGV